MRLHGSVIEKLLRVYETYGGHRNETKLRNALDEIDLSEYERQSTGEKILVLTEELNAEQRALDAARAQR